MISEKKGEIIWEIFVLILSVYVLIELSIEIIVPFKENIKYIFRRIDLYICLVFLVDFMYYFAKAEDKKNFFKRRWIDLLSSIPFTAILRVFRISRVFRLVRVLRIVKFLRGIKGLIPVIRFISSSKLRSILITYVFIMIIILLYGSLAFYMFENVNNNTVETFFDAFWWAFITVTSVGYGDIYPLTVEGRVIGIIITIAGMGMFSLITAELSAKFFKILKEDTKNTVNSICSSKIEIEKEIYKNIKTLKEEDLKILLEFIKFRESR